MRTLSLGEANISVINVGDFTWKLAEKLDAPEHEWRGHYAALFERPLLFPTQCLHIKLPGASVLVDPGRHDRPPEPSLVPAEYQQPPELLAQLLEKGIHPEEVTHIIITHAHFDHYASTTVERGGHWLPCFPNARCYLSTAEWKRPEIQEALQNPDSNESRTLGILQQQGLLELVEENFDLLPEVQIIAAPGETPGHQIVRIHSGEQTLYFLGDLYHHPIEVEQPTWMVRWKDRESNLRSRHAFTEAAVAEHAIFVAAHIPLGYLEHTSSGVKWTAL